ncbi:hypothetical protein P9E76_13720 [Schinkia azotoformans]|uniref:Uncharacterized protein n=1 Tax=Schinkia azotoformans LMG 9581 TaxID=1131731 RepID=K6DJV8_SCHAZ|nr:hypothetical protein [Schinkia azotoformans]EKN68418.1 hypothetical protein BAZO_05230 [Schinkia azotoformans LMG 9581]MEC1638468.1 hypothetical protein [Schinkia azotoformans]MEC1721325.1 hypothetical protein [Schinkia azotoformans]MEC1946098.1 hypothetical protein [Schinkia azotoformans]MED4351600.1 hypothetical protein [Schinkia azotoformans]
MGLFLKHEIIENEGRFEALLYVGKRHAAQLNEDGEFVQNVKKEAVAFIELKFPLVPIQVIRIMIGSVPYVAFATSIKMD